MNIKLSTFQTKVSYCPLFNYTLEMYSFKILDTLSSIPFKLEKKIKNALSILGEKPFDLHIFNFQENWDKNWDTW